MKKSLVLFSGGMDSFLAACRTINAGCHAVLFSCNNGCVMGEGLFEAGARRIINHYGVNLASWAGVYNNAFLISRLSESWEHSSIEHLAKRYPRLRNAHVRCLHCQSAMWTAAIAYAKAKQIPYIACGYKSTDVFCTGQPWYHDVMKELAGGNGIEARFPVLGGWPDNMERKSEMSDYGFLPKVREPQCLTGMQEEPMTDLMSEQLCSYMEEAVCPLMQPRIIELEQIFKANGLMRERGIADGNI